MPRIIPKSNQDRLDFFGVHAANWAGDPGAIGLSVERVAQVRLLHQRAAEAAAAARSARDAAEAATAAQDDAMRQLVEAGSAAVAQIKAFARGEPAILIRAELPVPGPGVTAQTPPPAPRIVAATPRSDGTLKISWRSDLRPGRGASFYRIERTLRIGATSTRGTVAAVRDGEYIDRSLPPGFSDVSYQIIPCRQRRGGPLVIGNAGRADYVPGRRAA